MKTEEGTRQAPSFSGFPCQTIILLKLLSFLLRNSLLLDFNFLYRHVRIHGSGLLLCTKIKNQILQSIEIYKM